MKLWVTFQDNHQQSENQNYVNILSKQSPYNGSDEVHSLRERDKSLTKEVHSLRDREASLAKEVHLLREKETSLVMEVAMLREQNELLEFRIVELEECPPNVSLSFAYFRK